MEMRHPSRISRITRVPEEFSCHDIIANLQNWPKCAQVGVVVAKTVFAYEADVYASARGRIVYSGIIEIGWAEFLDRSIGHGYNDRSSGRENVCRRIVMMSALELGYLWRLHREYIDRLPVGARCDCFYKGYGLKRY
jgi:hypothetical protein